MQPLIDITASQTIRINKDWWILKVPGAAFFGNSQSIVEGKYERWSKRGQHLRLVKG